MITSQNLYYTLLYNKCQVDYYYWCVKFEFNDIRKMILSGNDHLA